MTLEDVENRVAEIARFAKSDYVRAHGAEDDLLFAVLRVVASGAENGRELAAAALKVDDLDFPRWCA